MNGLPGSLPIGQERRESYLPEGKNLLVLDDRTGVFRALGSEPYLQEFLKLCLKFDLIILYVYQKLIIQED